MVDTNGMPTKYPLYTPPAGDVKDHPLTAKCRRPPRPAWLLCGDYAVNTIQPAYQPYAPGTPDPAPAAADRPDDRRPAERGRASTGPGTPAAGRTPTATSARPAGRTANGPTCSDPNALANAVLPNCPDKLFQFHHQPFNYYASFAPGTRRARSTCGTRQEFLAATASGGAAT